MRQGSKIIPRNFEVLLVCEGEEKEEKERGKKKKVHSSGEINGNWKWSWISGKAHSAMCNRNYCVALKFWLLKGVCTWMYLRFFCSAQCCTSLEEIIWDSLNSLGTSLLSTCWKLCCVCSTSTSYFYGLEVQRDFVRAGF